MEKHSDLFEYVQFTMTEDTEKHEMFGIWQITEYT